LINKLFNCARVRNEMIYRGEKLGWCAISGTPCISKYQSNALNNRISQTLILNNYKGDLSTINMKISQ